MPSLVRVDIETFFDRDAVLDALNKSEQRLLSKAGAFTRQTARRSIRKRNRPAEPGKPPSSHTGFYKRSILFGYDKPNHSVVIGPSATFGGDEVPNLLEFGGRAKRRGESVTYAARPHMRPALEKESDNFPELFKNSVTA